MLIHQNPKFAQIVVGADVPTSVLPAHPERVAATLAETTALTGIPRTTLYKMLGQGQLRAVKNSRRTLVVWRSVLDYFDSLPAATFRASTAQVPPDHIKSAESDATASDTPRRKKRQRQ